MQSQMMKNTWVIETHGRTKKKWVKFDAHTWKKRFAGDTWSKFDFCSLGLKEILHFCPILGL